MEPRSPERIPRFLGEHEVVRLIARGGMGAVYEVVAPRTGARYAAKTVLKGSDPTARARFQREVELLARCDRHPGIVKVHSLGESQEGGLFVILDLVTGEGLDALLERERTLAPGRAATLARDVANALAFVHAQGVVHRDVKPSNVLLDANAGGSPKLTDFGLATADDVERLTRTAQFVGTLLYCAPEQAASKPCGPTADVFALGCLLFHALAGAPPFEGGDALATLSKIASEQRAPDVRSLAREVPEPLARIVARALEKDPRARYPGGAELAADLDRFLAGERVLTKGSGRARGLKLLLAALVVVALGLAGGAIAGLGRRRVAASRALDEGRDALARATRALARARGSASPVTSASEVALAEAFTEATLALERLEDARAKGSSETSGSAKEAGSLVLEATCVAASWELASGDAAAALARLEARGVSSLDARLLRARALVALGRVPEGQREAEAVLAASTEERLLEPAADVFLAAGDARRAFALYARALELSSRRKVELRAKRGGAALRAGDEPTALADLAALVPDPTALAESRAANETFAPLAPVLYRRGLAAGAGAARERDLDAAWRLAAPPPEVAHDVARVWLESSGLRQVSDELFATGIAPRWEKIEQARLSLVRERRAVTIEPALDFDRRWDDAEVLRSWVDSSGRAGAMLSLVNALLPAWPDNPTLLYLTAKSRSRANPMDPEVLALVYAAIDRLPESPTTSPNVARLARSAALFARTTWMALGAPRDVFLAHATRVAEIADAQDVWLELSYVALSLSQDLERARWCLERARHARSAGKGDELIWLEMQETHILEAEGKPEEARACAFAVEARFHTDQSLEFLVTLLRNQRRLDDLVAAVRARRDASLKVLGVAEDALKASDRAAETIEIGKRIEALKASSPAR